MTMVGGRSGDGVESGQGRAAEERLARLEARVRELEGRLARYEPGAFVSLDAILDGPQCRLTPNEKDREVRRLLEVCADRGVRAVLADPGLRKDLLGPLADACFRRGLNSAGQYLAYLECPYD
jgi:hypothetical protein